MIEFEAKFQEAAVSEQGKRLYRTPVLHTFGKVAALTQSASGCNNNDSSGCTATPGSNMGPMVSDRGAKENIVRIGTHPLGIGLYLFDYKAGFRDQWGHGRQFGVMAQEVETVMPEAVRQYADGYKRVDYGMLGIVSCAR